MPKIPKLRGLLPPLAAALSLSACASTDPLTPHASRFERVALPPVPAGEARCDGSGEGAAEPCLSQRQVDHLFNATIDALCEANDRIAWLSDYYLGTELEPSCG